MLRHKNAFQHGHKPATGASKIYKAWTHMKGRCLNQNDGNFKNYGGRGIKICDRWLVFKNFLEDMGIPPDKNLTIERIDNDGDYKPDNCLWATRLEQGNNNRRCRFLTFNGKTKSVSMWGVELNVPASRIIKRLNLGWTVRDALLKGKRRNQYV